MRHGEERDSSLLHIRIMRSKIRGGNRYPSRCLYHPWLFVRGLVVATYRDTKSGHN